MQDLNGKTVHKMKYDAIPSLSGVYKIYFLPSARFYIGSTVNFKKRYLEHIHRMKNNTHDNIPLLNAFKKYGIKNMCFEIVEYVEIEKLLVREQWYLDTLKPEYNICKIAGSCLGVKRSIETCKKISQSNAGRAFSDEHKARIRKAHLGKKRGPASPSTKEKISKAQKGKPKKKLSENHRESLSAALKGKPKNPGHVAKVAAAKKGSSHSEESKAKMSEAQKRRFARERDLYGSILGTGRKHSEETREKQSKAKKGRTLSPETRQRMSEAQRKRREREAETHSSTPPSNTIIASVNSLNPNAYTPLTLWDIIDPAS